MAFRKRVYASAFRPRFSRAMKRRRTGRMFNRRRRARRSTTWTSQSAFGNQLQYRSRKLRKRAWRRKLWNDTLASQHYRSSGVNPVTITTSTAQGDGLVTALFPTFIGAVGPATAFWTVAGGLQPTDAGAAAVTFDETDLVIRGGRVGITITCPDTITEEIGITIYVVQMYNDPDFTIQPTIVTYGSMIDSAPDVNRRLFKVLYNKSAILSNVYSSFSLEHRLRVQKVDQETHGTRFGNQIAFYVTATPLQSSPAVGFDLPALVYHDLSFTGDSV